MSLFDGKVAIITGAGNGIGRAHALYLSERGAAVVVNDLGGARDGHGGGRRAADEVVAAITAAGGKAIANYDSVATLEGAQRIVWAAVNKLGRVDILVNNAGILRDRTLMNMSEAEFDAVIAVHLKGTYLMTQAVARQMKLQGTGGRIVNTSSVSGLIGNFGQGNYAAAKAGIYGLTRTASMELQKIGVTVNAIAPVARTRMTEDLPMFESVGEETMGPQHIAPVVAFLASDASANLTGKILGVEGRRVFEYRMHVTAGVTRSDDDWTPESIADQLDAICA